MVSRTTGSSGEWSVGEGDKSGEPCDCSSYRLKRVSGLPGREGEPIQTWQSPLVEETECRVHGGQGTANGKGKLLQRRAAQQESWLSYVYLERIRQNGPWDAHDTWNNLCFYQPERIGSLFPGHWAESQVSPGRRLRKLWHRDQSWPFFLFLKYNPQARNGFYMKKIVFIQV